MVNRSSKEGLTELDRILSRAFPGISPGERTALGQSIDREIAKEGLAPGITYQGGPQRQERGQGRLARKAGLRWAKLLDGIDLAKCGILANEDCLEILSRMLEQTFRNMYLHAARPAHIDPPYIARPFDARTPNGFVTLVAGAAFVDVAVFTAPPGVQKVEVRSAGQGIINILAPPGLVNLDDAVSFRDTEWRIVVSGQPFEPWAVVTSLQIWKFAPPTDFCTPIHMGQGDTIRLQARSFALPRDVTGRLCGYVYTPRSDAGEGEARSTIVD